MNTSTKENTFAGAAGGLGAGIDALFTNTDAQFSLIPLDMIEIKVQIREDFEDEENTLADLAASIKARGVLQPILLRSNTNGYELIAGERRYRASKLAGLEQIPAFIREMNDEEADDAQLAENIHRKNLTQIEEAKKIQRDLDKLGSVEAVLEKHQKSRPWLSKMLSLLNLPEQAKRLVAENVSADVEVINTVKTIEKADPVKARALVDDLKKTRGKENARDKAAAVKEEVKPSKKPKAAKGEKMPEAKEQGGVVATPPDRSHEEPGPVAVFSGAKTEGGESFNVSLWLNSAYVNVFEHGSDPKMVLMALDDDEKGVVTDWLQDHFDAGRKAKDTGRAVIHGFRFHQFGHEGAGALALVAFLHGAEGGTKFNALNILGCVKQ